MCVCIYFIADKKPEMSELNKYLVKYCGLWRAIGLKLGLEDDLLETIARDNPKHQECFRVMLQKWLIQDVSATWNSLELAITNAQRDDLSLDNLSESMLTAYSIQYTVLLKCNIAHAREFLSSNEHVSSKLTSLH